MMFTLFNMRNKQLFNEVCRMTQSAHHTTKFIKKKTFFKEGEKDYVDRNVHIVAVKKAAK